ncbi:hypothetical protein BDV12DRAFT_189153 [Aspergillus spectabilis]
MGRRERLQRQLAPYHNVRTVVDTVQICMIEIFFTMVSFHTLLGFTVHTNFFPDIKANNILGDYNEAPEGPLCSSTTWRSPESWCRSRQNEVPDVFSFAIVIIYVMLSEMVLRVSDTSSRYVSYFGDEQGLHDFLEHIGEDNPFHERFTAIASSFPSENPRQPFEHWNYVEQGLRDTVGTMTNLDPGKRMTARQALEHRWFRQATSEQ